MNDSDKNNSKNAEIELIGRENAGAEKLNQENVNSQPNLVNIELHVNGISSKTECVHEKTNDHHNGSRDANSAADDIKKEKDSPAQRSVIGCLNKQEEEDSSSNGCTENIAKSCNANGSTDNNNVINVSSDDDVDDESNGPASKKRISSCEICEEKPSLYTCPRCSMKTCSLQCVKEHKSRLDCNGERDKTAFVPISQYGDMHLLNDYRFLEDAERALYSNKIVPQNKQRHMAAAPHHLNKRSKLLITAAYKRGVKLMMVSPALSKNRNNSSFYIVKEDRIEWHVEWQFVVSNTLVKDPKVPEVTPLIEAANKFVNFVEFPHLRKALENYKKNKLSSCKFLLKVEGLPANQPRYYPLKQEASIADNLRGHCLTEYPTIFVVPEGYKEKEFLTLTKEDIPSMHKDNVRHILLYHPELNIRPEIESQLLNPNSNLYSAKT